MNHEGRKKKRKQQQQQHQERQQQNPLSTARKVDDKIQSLWHRKSGIGYRLFVSYYGGQPEGIVVESKSSVVTTAPETTSLKNNTSTSSNNIQYDNGRNVGKGLSRAAKRRKKKKGQNRSVENSHDDLKDTNGSNNNDIKKDDICQASHSSDNNCLTLSMRKEMEINNDDDESFKRSGVALLKSSTPLLHAQNNGKLGSNHHLKPYLKYLMRPLPLTFRIRATADPRNVDSLEMELDTLLKQDDNSTKQIIRAITTTNNGSKSAIYQTSHLPKSQLSPQLSSLLLHYNENGTIARQDLGSMLPVLAVQSLILKRAKKLSSQSKDDELEEEEEEKKRSSGSSNNKGIHILDMCACPGSKTLQALEQLLLQCNRNNRIIANDVHPRRVQTLQEAIDRSGVLISENNRTSYSEEQIKKKMLFFTNHDASIFPMPCNSSGSKARPFDFILCDVPCSGDGTVRKDGTILPMWTPRTSNALHSLQVRILHRALELAHPTRGIVCYSTCSLNPVENEAVVAAVLQKWKEEDIEILDWQSDADALHLLPTNFQTRPGVTHWRVADWKPNNDDENDDADYENDEDAFVKWYDTFESAKDEKMLHAEPTFWPSSWSPEISANLRKCARLWPQDMDSGGFFLAVLRRKK